LSEVPGRKSPAVFLGGRLSGPGVTRTPLHKRNRQNVLATLGSWRFLLGRWQELGLDGAR